ncbi:hypothetical protein [Acinetobacter soli]|uniref:hypothetical protein n=1 Tax=Acinetobacter soli TaxID=487316 RepID=UPI000E6AA57A|nr:hypothetical protein [Acinetobacter soli]
MNLKQQYQTNLITDALLHSLHTQSPCTVMSQELLNIPVDDDLNRQFMSFYYLPELTPVTQQQIRTCLNNLDHVGYVELDQQTHHLAIYHDGPVQPIEAHLNQNGIQLVFQQTQTNYIPEPIDWSYMQLRNQMISWLLSINLVMLIVTFLTGVIASSTALMALGLILLSDVMIYAMMLFAIQEKQVGLYKLTRAGVYLQLGLSLLLMFGVALQIVMRQSAMSQMVVLVGLLALLTMLVNMWLLIQTHAAELDLNWKTLLSFYEVVFSLAVVIAGLLCLQLNSNWPDIVMTVLMVMFLLNRSRKVFQKKTSFVIQ